MTLASKRTKLVVGTAGVALLGLTACSSGSSTGSGAAADDKVLTVQVLTGDQNPAIAEAVNKGFLAQNPGWTIKTELIAGDAMGSTNLTKMSGNNPPDVGMLNHQQPAYITMIKNKQLVELGDVWKAANLDTRYSAELNKALEREGGHYSMAISQGFINIIFYNADAFQAAGITEPADHRFASMAELKSAADKLRAKGLEPLAFGGKGNGSISHLVSGTLQTAATGDQLANYETTYNPSVPITANFTDPAFTKAVETVKAYQDQKIFAEGANSSETDAAQASFVAGKAGMLHNGYWAAPALTDKAAGVKFKLGWALIPPVDGAATPLKKLDSFYAINYCIASKAKHVDMAKKYLEYLVSVEAQTNATIKVGSQIPSVNDVPEANLAGLNPMVAEMALDANKNGTAFAWGPGVPDKVGQSMIGTALNKMLTGQATVAEVGQTAQDALVAFRQDSK